MKIDQSARDNADARCEGRERERERHSDIARPTEREIYNAKKAVR